MSIATQIEILQLGRSLIGHEVSETISRFLSGDYHEDEAKAWLLAMEAKPITATELSAAQSTVMARAKHFPNFPDALDCCGTGGDGAHTLNVSTATAFVVAACGQRVVKHGNRAVSSKSGSSDVLGELGIAPDTPVETLEAQANNGLTFLFAPLFHGGLKGLAPLRKAIGSRTLFNVLGPLCNPARPGYQLLGVYDKTIMPLMAETLQKIGAKAAMVVHSEDGHDEISITAPTYVLQLKDGEITERTITPEEAGLNTYDNADAIKGGDAKHNAAALRAMLQGEAGAYRDAVLLNAAACLEIAGKATNLNEGATLAAEAIDSGKAFAMLTQLSENHD